MKLAYSITQCAQVMNGTIEGQNDDLITHVVYDTRKIIAADGGLFFALHGLKRDGSSFIRDALSKGIRLFVVSSNVNFNFPTGTAVIRVVDPLKALQDLAHFHRKQFTYPVIAITGSVGKTTFKEWAFHLLSPHFKIVRSPKSFNSQIGVALSLLELTDDANLALIEAGISREGEMEILQQMIAPDFGVFTAFGSAHRSNFSDSTVHLAEKLRLFKDTKLTFVPDSLETISDSLPANFQICPKIENQLFSEGYYGLLGVLTSLCTYLQVDSTEIKAGIQHLPRLALRMELFDGINGNQIINDTYNLDSDALHEALLYLRNFPSTKKRVVVIGLSEASMERKKEISDKIAAFQIDELFLIGPDEQIPWETISQSIVLIKASRDRRFEHEVALGKAIKHRTYVEVNLGAIRSNLMLFKSILPTNTRILGMVKANGYGAGAVRMAQFLAAEGAAYLGVAYADEGVKLREAGITLPIIVMNPDIEHAASIIDYQLEPAIYSFQQLDEFITFLIHKGIENFPIQLKFDTGMHRLGFDPKDAPKVLASINAQPEIRVKGLYSHMADADNFENHDFSQHQIQEFKKLVSYFEAQLNEKIIAHLMNSEGALAYPGEAFNMVRLGIALYGYSDNPAFATKLESALRWLSTVSQVKQIQAGETVGYGRTFCAEKDLEIAIIPVGYADGFGRNLSNGKGEIVIQNKRCKVIGRVCMDMVMVDVTGLGVRENDAVELIGENLSMNEFAANSGTIPYEIMTSLSARMERLYTDN